jgi:hypothetical protein
LQSVSGLVAFANIGTGLYLQSMNTFIAGLLSGVLVTFAGFVLKSLVSDLIRGFRTRTLITAELRESIRGLREHFPELRKIEDGLQNGGAAFIRDRPATLPEYAKNAIHHLNPVETARCWKFDDCLVRLDAIRQEYNNSVRAVLTDETNRDRYKNIAIACIHDLSFNYRQAIFNGSNLLIQIANNHLFLGIDTTQCDADLNRFAGGT